MPRGHVTLHDVAREAGVHPATVSRALSLDKRLLVNADTVERVRAAADRLGYVADPIARALRGGGTSRQVGVMVRTLRHPWVSDFLSGIDQRTATAGYTPWVTPTGDDPLRVRTLVGGLTAWRAGGLVISTARVPDEVVIEAAETGIPMVVVTREAPDQVCCAVNTDNVGGVRTAVGHLTRLGHRRIAYIAGPPELPVPRSRLRGFREAILDSGIRPDPGLIRVADGDSIEDGEACCRELLASGPPVTAIAAGNDWLAIGCYSALAEAGLRCPEDVSVIGFDDMPLTDRLCPSLTTMHMPSYEMGVEAAGLIMAQMRGEPVTPRTVLLAAELVVRDSTARVRDLRHARVEKYLRSGHDLGHTDVVKKVGTGPAYGSYDGAAGSRSERGTRGQVARLILELGPSTAATLGGRLGLTPAAIRRHLDNLIGEGMVETRTARTYGNRGRGRPAKLFVITDAGRSAFEHAYDDLATSALRFLAEKAGPEAVAEFARRQLADTERRYARVVEGSDTLADRVRALAEALSADGYAASAGPAPAGEQMCQHHCPVAHVAAEFPQLCEAETEAFGRLLGTPVQRLATIAHGDGICTTHVTDKALLAGKLIGPRAVGKQTGHVTEESGGLATS